MADMGKKKIGWKQKLAREMIEYLINAAYLTLFFSVFTTYRRLILAHYQISYGQYGISLIKALVLAKIIMIGNVLRLGRRIEDKPLIFPTLYKTVVFTLWVALFSVIESTIRGLLHGKGLAGGLSELASERRYEFLASALVVFFAFIPFFAFRELEQVLGEGKISQLFIRRSRAAEPGPSGCKKEQENDAD